MNLIAHALATGKSVLFVSEKMAALNVVRQRLAECGLGPFCLELHSHKSNKREVLQQLQQALDQVSSHTSSEDWLREANKLASLRHELNAYVRALHKTRETGESLFYGLSQLIGLREATRVDLAWPAEVEIERETLALLRDLVHQLAVAAQDCPHPATSVWASVGYEEWSLSWRNDVEKNCRQLETLTAELQQMVEQLIPLVAMEDLRGSADDLENLDHLAQILLSAPVTPATLVAQPDWETLNSSITAWIAHGRRRDELRGILYQRYTARILQLDLEALVRRLALAEKSWALLRWFGRWQVRRRLAQTLKPGEIMEVAKMSQDLETACALRDEETILDQAGAQARELLGHFWRDGEADWEEVAQVRDWAASLRQLAVKIAGTEVERVPRLRQRWAALVSEGHAQLAAEGPVGQQLLEYRRRLSAFNKGREALASLLKLDSQIAWGDPRQAGYLARVMARLHEWQAHLQDLRAWCFWRRCRRQAIEHGLGALVIAFEKEELSAASIEETFKRSFYQWWVEKIIDTEPALKGFFRQDFEDKIHQFREVDERYTRLTRAEIQARLAARLPQRGQPYDPNPNSELGILQRQLQRQRGQMPIRQLFQKIPNLLPRLKPCLLMSPISVAQYLDPAYPPFDLVVFDEASQIPVWDAVGAMARGREVIIVGDPQQLPPTNFFTRVDAEEMDNEDLVEDLESIIDDCLAARLPQMHLRWHYRSRHESLITFSNYQYYENRLLTFPSPFQQRGVTFHLVNGRYDRAKSRTNLEEAKAIVEEIMRRSRTPALAQLSVGVVTFNLSQQRLIEDLLEEERRKNPELESFFDPDSAPAHEPLFVKNLENVQGDERDVILFSICYGPDDQGRVVMNFGPLNREGGHRRLNVAITRARQEVMVFSTLRAEQIDLSRTRFRGVADLKYFLDYAARGPAALAQQQFTNPAAECESLFEEQVYTALCNRGYTVHQQVGCSGYRIDLAVVDPDQPGYYLLGIECDGANYHRAKTARDRDYLRERVLRNLGWRLHRIWSSDWWERPEAELARLEAAIAEAQRSKSTAIGSHAGAQKIAAAPVIAPPPAGEKREPSKIAPNQMQINEIAFPRYQPYAVTQVLGNLQDFYSPSSGEAIRQVIDAVVAQEGPVSLEIVAQRVAEHWGIHRLGPKVKERVRKLVPKTILTRTCRGGAIFLWPNGIKPETYRDFRVPGGSDQAKREANALPPEEIANGALHLLQGQVSLPLDDLVVETARLFGFQRTGPMVSQCMRAGIMLLLKRGEAQEQEGKIVLLSSSSTSEGAE